MRDNEKVDTRLEEMCAKFVKRGYPEPLVQKCMEEAKNYLRTV